jgi:hypothetical protein
MLKIVAARAARAPPKQTIANTNAMLLRFMTKPPLVVWSLELTRATPMAAERRRTEQ